MINPLISELLGTLFFVMCILSWGEPIPIAAGLLAAIYAVGKVSGGHFNPAVSFMKYIKGDITMYKLGIYICAQILGAMLALMWWKLTVGSMPVIPATIVTN
jgi:glycerol uptake facilitator-like aquaporin